MQTTNGSDSSLATPGGTTPPPPQQWQQQQQQHWMAAMQYPGAAAMMMMQQQQQMMMYPHQYVPYNYQQHPQFQYASYHQQQEHKTHERGSGDDVKTLWIGDLLHWMDETYLHTCFSHTGEALAKEARAQRSVIVAGGHGANGFMAHGSQSDGESNNSTEDGEETQGSSGMEDTHNEDKVTTMEDMLTTTTPTTILPSLEDKKRINFIMAMVA
ncbi:hypothetical protein HID58_054040 [Brassica napus]|uniref:Uncharacterized protein n=1 Tax=Brassica napus TaxID=3708 RepID=A0ABQ8AGD2_BRANA|nr:hypothetical protein HID58_054040 [Brassica napus]